STPRSRSTATVLPPGGWPRGRPRCPATAPARSRRPPAPADAPPPRGDRAAPQARLVRAGCHGYRDGAREVSSDLLFCHSRSSVLRLPRDFELVPALDAAHVAPRPSVITRPRSHSYNDGVLSVTAGSAWSASRMSSSVDAPRT